MTLANCDRRSAAVEGTTDSVISHYYGPIPLDFLMVGDTHDCPYLPGREAIEEFFLAEHFPPELYHDFMDHGFRRSGRIIYRPICQSCRECRPIRVPTGTFMPNKSQRRVLRKNENVEIRVHSPKFSKEKFKIYSDYLLMKHDTISDESPVNFRDSLYSSPVTTVEFEYRVRGSLVGAGIADLSSRSLSSVYMFYRPDCSARSLGTFSAIQEILFCQEHSIPYHYLGFCVHECPSMNYKERFRPHEILDRSLNWMPGQEGRAGMSTSSTELSVGASSQQR